MSWKLRRIWYQRFVVSVELLELIKLRSHESRREKPVRVVPLERDV
jgi:hypothetical protein